MATSGFTWANRTNHASDQIGRMAVAVKGWVLGARLSLAGRGHYRAGVRAHEAVPAGLDGLDPFRVLPQRDARDFVPVRLLLDATGVSEDDARLGGQRRE